MRNPIRNLLYFSRTERRGILVLCGLIVLAIGGQIAYHCCYLRPGRPSPADLALQDSLLREYDTFVASLQRYETSGSKGHPQQRRTPRTPPALTPFPFDPNTADSADFRRMGLPGWMARNIVRYRQKGGRFRRPHDFRKIYGLTDEQYATLAPYIRIAAEPEDSRKADAPPTLWRQAETDSTRRTVKYPAGTVVDLNRADTAELKRIPGIGSGIARLIVGYRQRLGGFHHIGQLEEIRLDSRQLSPWFRIDTTAIRRIPLNHAGVEQLRRHPYLNFYQARAIVEWRRKHGRLRSLKPLALYDEFTADDLRRLQPYVCFD